MSTLKVIIHTENPHDHQKVRKGKLDCVMTVLSRRFCEIADLSKIEEMDRPCLYLLVDEGRKAYIGQTTSFRLRVKDHLGKKRWWTRAYVFVSGSNQYDQASITYLEYLAIREGLATGSYDLSENGQKPTKPILQEGDSSDYDEIFEEIKFFLNYERCFVFVKPEVNTKPEEPLQQKVVVPEPAAKEYPLFFLRHANHSCVAKGYPLNDGTNSFVVLKGSEISVKESNTKGGSARVEMLKHCTLYGDEKYVLNEDFVFDSPSGAAGACLGRSSNGYDVWKTEAGVTLKSYLENLKQAHP
jgi:GIY-YIG catalytic domain protein